MHPLVPLCLTPLHLADIAEHSRPPAPPRAAAAFPVTCVEPATLARSQGFRGEFDMSETTDHFLIAWESTNTAVTEDAVATYIEAFETSWTVEIDQLGWRAPDQTDACLMTVLLTEFDESWGDTGGYTDVVESGGTPYMILNTAWLDDGDGWTQTLVAHEFNHASQFGYDIFWEEADWWYWESTAEWVPDLVYDDANTYTWSLWAYLDAPWLALSSYTGMVQYGHFAFNVHLEEEVGVDTPRAVWAAAGPDDAVEDVVASVVGADFGDILADYTSRIAALDVAEQDVWLEAIGYFEIEMYTDEVDTYPASGAVDGRQAPQHGGQNFLHLAGAPDGDVVFQFAGAPDVDGVATEWAVTLATAATGGGITHHTPVRADADGAAELLIVGLGVDVTDAWIGVVPLGAIGEEGADWSWSAKLAHGAPVAEEPAACACGTTEMGGIWGLLAVGLVVGRRRGIQPGSMSYATVPTAVPSVAMSTALTLPRASVS